MSDRPFPAGNNQSGGGRFRRRSVVTLGGAGAMIVAALIGFLPSGGLGSTERADTGRVRAIDSPTTLDSLSADRIARRASAAQADVNAVWRYHFRQRFGRTYAPPQVIHYTGRRPSPCAGSTGISGLAYCAQDRTVSIDLAFMNVLSEALGAGGDRAVVLLVARVGAEHVQGELAILGDADRARRGLPPEAAAALDRDLALQGDCLTGVWARSAVRHLGAVEPAFWGKVVAEVRAASAEAAAASGLAAGEPDAREAAFARGYAEGEVRDCLAPGLSGVLG